MKGKRGKWEISHYNFLKKNRRGLSAIIITIIMIALAMVAVGIIWAVINNLLSGEGSDIDLQKKCLGIDVSPKTAACAANATENNCEIVLKRTASGDEIAGVKIVLGNGTDSNVIDEAGNIAPLATKTVVASSGLVNTDRVEISVYLSDEVGKETTCSQAKTLDF